MLREGSNDVERNQRIQQIWWSYDHHISFKKTSHETLALYSLAALIPIKVTG